MHYPRRINRIAVVAFLLSSTVSAKAQNQSSGFTGSLIAETADLILFNGQIYTPEGWAQALAVKDAIDSGALVVPGSDWNVAPSVDPWVANETMATRQKPGGGGEALGEAEKITLQQAFDLFTVNAALQMVNRSKTGSIEKGQLADLLASDRNPFKIPVTQIHETKVKLTLINNEVVYQAPTSTKGAD
jgi:predicted amidohydrolase YtcJ